MLRTLIFGAIAGYVGKKLYDEGKLTEFKEDLVGRYNQAKADIAEKRSDSDYAPRVGGVATAGAPASPIIVPGP